MSNQTKEIQLLPTQAKVHLINAKFTYCVWQRAGGKTSGGIGPRIDRLRTVMPRSQILLVSDTYERLKDRIVPNVIEFFENKFGLIDGVDFVKYKKPPDHFATPIVPLDKFDNVISFSDGTSLCLVSLKISGSGNAYNAQAMICDEAKYCSEEKLNSEVIPALRGAIEFKHLPEYRSQWYFTDKYGPGYKWIDKKKEKSNPHYADVIYALQHEKHRLLNLIKQNPDAKDNSIYKRRVTEFDIKCDKIRKQMVYFSEMPAYENLPVVGQEFFTDMKRVLKPYEYNVSILNMDPGKVEHCFYPSFTQKNKYKTQKDYNPTLPLIIALDYQWRITPIPVAQISTLPGSQNKTLNFINEIYTLHPDGIEAAINKFCNYYASHEVKNVVYPFDHTAIGRNPIGTTFKDVVVQTFNRNNWTVTEHYTGQAPDHDIKFERLKEFLNNQGDMGVMINELTCPALIKSIEQSPAIISGYKTKKDKRTEADLNFPAEESTHFSDAFDQVLWATIELNIISDTQRTAIDFMVR